MKQYAMNACGSIALFHIISNLPKDEYDNLVTTDSRLRKFVEANRGKTPKEIGELFNDDSGIKGEHKDAVVEGDTEIEEEPEEDLHFISFVMKGGSLIELDGLRDIAINHGETSQDKFLYDIMKVVKAYIARDSENPSFSMMCLAPKPEW